MIEFETPALMAPDGCIIGVIEEGPSHLEATRARRIGTDDPIPSEPGDFILDHTLSKSDAVTKSRAVSRLVELRRAGATFVLITHDEPLLESCADEIWWLRGGALIARGDPGEVLAQYRRRVAEHLRAAGENQLPRLSPTLRNGDARATLESIELLGENGRPSIVWRSGEPAAIRVSVRFAD